MVEAQYNERIEKIREQCQKSQREMQDYLSFQYQVGFIHLAFSPVVNRKCTQRDSKSPRRTGR